MNGDLPKAKAKSLPIPIAISPKIGFSQFPCQPPMTLLAVSVLRTET
ncbi:hypothetical protein [Helicobacter sp. 16-1353]|nr:hypothetical protein [Helicobacter sp. 16-1353]